MLEKMICGKPIRSCYLIVNVGDKKYYFKNYEFTHKSGFEVEVWAEELQSENIIDLTPEEEMFIKMLRKDRVINRSRNKIGVGWVSGLYKRKMKTLKDKEIPKILINVFILFI